MSSNVVRLAGGSGGFGSSWIECAQRFRVLGGERRHAAPPRLARRRVRRRRRGGVRDLPSIQAASRGRKGIRRSPWPRRTCAGPRRAGRACGRRARAAGRPARRPGCGRMPSRVTMASEGAVSSSTRALSSRAGSVVGHGGRGAQDFRRAGGLAAVEQGFEQVGARFPVAGETCRARSSKRRV